MKQSDIYTEALTCLRSILLADHPEFQNWIDWLERDIQDWNQRREVAHHLRAYGGMGSFNDLPSMRGNHDYIFDFLKSVCYAFGHLYGKREGISPEALMEECLHDVEQAAYHPHKALNQTTMSKDRYPPFSIWRILFLFFEHHFLNAKRPLPITFL